MVAGSAVALLVGALLASYAWNSFEWNRYFRQREQLWRSLFMALADVHGRAADPLFGFAACQHEDSGSLAERQT